MNAPTSRFNLRAFTSVFLACAFLSLAASGAVLFLSPPGRVANWTNWTLGGLRKSDWTALHVWFSVVFLAGAALHLVFNFRPMLSYLTRREPRRLAWRGEWVAAAVASVVIVAGTILKAPPFPALLAWSESLKESWEKPAEQAPLPHAERLTVAALSRNLGLEPAAAVQRLRAAGIEVTDPGQTLQALADGAKLSARQVYERMRGPAAGHEGGGGGGPGSKTLVQYCADEGIAPADARARLAAGGITVSENDAATLREIASRAGRKPYDLVALIRGGQ